MSSALPGLIDIFIFSIGGLLGGVTSILIGVLLSKIEDVLYTLDVFPEDGYFPPRKERTIKMIKLIGLLMIISGALSVLSRIMRVLSNLTGIGFS